MNARIYPYIITKIVHIVPESVHCWEKSFENDILLDELFVL